MSPPPSPARHPSSLTRSSEFAVEIAGQAMEVFHTEAAAFANFVMDPPQAGVEVVVRYLAPMPAGAACTIRPLRHGLGAALDGGTLKFHLPSALKLSIEIEGARPLFLWANPPETNPPGSSDPGVHFFCAGKTHEIGCLDLGDNETVYIEAGAVVKGRLHVRGKSNVRVCGQGIFDGSSQNPPGGSMLPSIFFERCRNVTVEDITMIHPSGWMVVPGACDGVRVRNLKQIGEVMSSDGIDVVGSRNVHIQDCFLRNNDDCVAVKALVLGRRDPAGLHADMRECPENILIENCTLVNGPCGHAMEIGHELSVDTVRDITFRNIDVLSVHGTGAVFSIHNCGRARVENVLFDDVRIEHCYDKFIDFRITRSRYSSDEEHGSVCGVTLRNITWHQTEFNPGYTVSLVSGWDASHRIDDVTLENIVINGRRVTSLDELDICTRHAGTIRLL